MKSLAVASSSFAAVRFLHFCCRAPAVEGSMSIVHLFPALLDCFFRYVLCAAHVLPSSLEDRLFERFLQYARTDVWPCLSILSQQVKMDSSKPYTQATVNTRGVVKLRERSPSYMMIVNDYYH